MSHDYLLGQGNLAATRLYFQHEMTKTNFDGYLIDPSIPLDRPDLKLADVASGTCAWALDVADRVPESTQIDCLDVNLSEAPPASWLPKNVRLRQFDIREPIAKDLLEQYDIVHVRYVVMFVLDADFDTIFGKFISLLKPGGYIQWTECDGLKWTWRNSKNTDDVPEIKKLAFLTGQLIQSGPRLWVGNMRNLFATAGLVEIKSFDAAPKVSTLEAATWNYLLSMQEATEIIYERYPEKRDQIDAWRQQLKSAIMEQRTLKVGMNLGMTRCIGRKKP